MEKKPIVNEENIRNATAGADNCPLNPQASVIAPDMENSTPNNPNSKNGINTDIQTDIVLPVVCESQLRIAVFSEIRRIPFRRAKRNTARPVPPRLLEYGAPHTAASYGKRRARGAPLSAILTRQRRGSPAQRTPPRPRPPRGQCLPASVRRRRTYRQGREISRPCRDKSAR